MRLHILVNVMAALCALALTLLLSGLAVNYQQSRQAVEDGAVIDYLQTGMNELRFVMVETILYQAPRSLQQWDLKHASMLTLLQAQVFALPREQALLNRMRSDHQTCDVLYKRLAGIAPTSPGERSESDGSELRARTLSTLMLLTQEMLDDANELSRLNQAHIIIAQSQGDTLMLLTVALVGAIMAWIWWLIRRRILLPIAALQNGTALVAAGNLDHRLDLGGADEIAKLAQAFDRMTERLRLARGELLESEGLKASVLDHAAYAIIATDPGGVIRVFNPGAAALLGYRSADLIGKATLLPFHDPAELRDRAQALSRELGRTIDGEGVEALVAKARATGLADENEWTFIHKDGRRIPVILSVTARTDPRGELVGYLGMAIDITERKQSQRRMEHLLAEQEALLENELIGIVTVKNRLIVWANPAFEKMLGYGPGELAGTPTRRNYPSEEGYLAFGAASYPVLESGGIYRAQMEQRRRDGSSVWVEISGAMLDRDTEESLWAFLDVTERRTLEQIVKQSEQRMELALSGADLGLWDLDIASGSFTHSPRLVTMVGYAPGEIEVNAASFLAGIHPDDSYAFGSVFYAHLKGQLPRLEVEYRMRHKDGHWVWILSRGMVVERNAEGRALRMTGTNLDISERKHSEEQIRELAYYDPLTGLPNRRLLLDRLGLALPTSARRASSGAILFIDLDNFKDVNDREGHEYGDLLLTEAARRLSSCVRAQDTVARLGGDEFVVMLEDLSADPAYAQTQAEVIAKKACAALGASYALRQKSHRCTASIGVCLFKGSEVAIADLLKRADSAMYEAKAAGRDTIRFYRAAPQG